VALQQIDNERHQDAVQQEETAMLPPNLRRVLAEDEYLESLSQETRLMDFVEGGWRYVEPAAFQSNWHVEAVCDHLQAIADGELTRCIFNLPPRHMKSLGSNVFFPAWIWLQPVAKGEALQPDKLRGPGVKFMYLTYDQQLSTRDSIKCRQLIESLWYQERWGYRFDLRHDQNTKTRFDNMQGGHRIATSSNGMATGEGADIIVWDDPHNIKHIESDTIRLEQLRTWDEVLPTRLNNPKTGVFLVIMQRSHERDLTGHILAKETGWTHLCLPARYEPDHPYVYAKGIPHSTSSLPGSRYTWKKGEPWHDPRTPGEPLWHGRFPKEVLDEWSMRLGSHADAGQLQQRPTARKGGLFEREWFEIVNAVPAGCMSQRVRAWDLASSTEVKEDPDYTAGVLMSRDPTTGIFYVEDVRRDRWSPKVIRTTLRNVATQDGYGCRIRVPCDPGQAGKFQASDIISWLAGFVVHAEAESDSKGVRADPLSAQAEAGNVKLVRGAWNDLFLDELCAFPTASHDDQVDAASAAFRALVMMPNLPLQSSYGESDDE
jgi:predicted phage terminase large subunit-like protein